MQIPGHSGLYSIDITEILSQVKQKQTQKQDSQTVILRTSKHCFTWKKNHTNWNIWDRAWMLSSKAVTGGGSVPTKQGLVWSRHKPGILDANPCWKKVGMDFLLLLPREISPCNTVAGWRESPSRYPVKAIGRQEASSNFSVDNPEFQSLRKQVSRSRGL